MTHLVEVSSTNERGLYVDKKKIREYICDELGVVWDRYIYQLDC